MTTMCVGQGTSLGKEVSRAGIRSSIGPFSIFPDYRVEYPESVVAALAGLYGEYNKAFAPLVEANREWPGDYQCCMTDGQPMNHGVQIDMVGLAPEYLEGVDAMSQATVREDLRRMIFEIENSLAMYSLLEGLFSRGQDSYFKVRFRRALNGLRRHFNRPIALLAVTQGKYEAMKAIEFGKDLGEPLSDAEVCELSGFDKFFSPDEYMTYLHDGQPGNYLLYARTSDPVAKLKDPKLVVEHPLLGDASVRQAIKESSLTFNIDDPEWPTGDRRRINDTKMHMPETRMGYLANAEEDVLTAELSAHLAAGKGGPQSFNGRRLNPNLSNHLLSVGVSLSAVDSAEVLLRAKPAQGAYGCYGHCRGHVGDRRFRNELRKGLRDRGTYIIQPELEIPTVENAATGCRYTYIDRVFFATVAGEPSFMGGFRSFMPADTVEAHKGRNHGNGSTVYAEII